MIDKRIDSLADAVADIFDGATVLIGGFGEAGSSIELIHAHCHCCRSEYKLPEMNLWCCLSFSHKFFFRDIRAAFRPYL